MLQTFCLVPEKVSFVQKSFTGKDVTMKISQSWPLRIGLAFSMLLQEGIITNWTPLTYGRVLRWAKLRKHKQNVLLTRGFFKIKPMLKRLVRVNIFHVVRLLMKLWKWMSAGWLPVLEMKKKIFLSVRNMSRHISTNQNHIIHTIAIVWTFNLFKVLLVLFFLFWWWWWGGACLYNIFYEIFFLLWVFLSQEHWLFACCFAYGISQKK